MHLYSDQFSSSHDFTVVEKPSKVLIIASTARSGSHMLGHSLYQTGEFGFPLEYANPANVAEWKKRFNKKDFYSTLKEIQKRRTSENGVFSIKIHYPHIKMFGDFKSLIHLFPDAYFVLLSRKNVLKQAVSLSMAKKTGVWIAGQKPTNENPEYSFNHIDRCLRDTILNNASWRYTLAASGCNYIEMDFEAICQDLGGSIKRIADFMSVEIDQNRLPNQPPTRKQLSIKKRDWMERFLLESDSSAELLNTSDISFFNRIKRKLSAYLNPSDNFN